MLRIGNRYIILYVVYIVVYKKGYDILAWKCYIFFNVVKEDSVFVVVVFYVELNRFKKND